MFQSQPVDQHPWPAVLGTSGLRGLEVGAKTLDGRSAPLAVVLLDVRASGPKRNQKLRTPAILHLSRVQAGRRSSNIYFAPCWQFDTCVLFVLMISVLTKVFKRTMVLLENGTVLTLVNLSISVVSFFSTTPQIIIQFFE